MTWAFKPEDEEQTDENLKSKFTGKCLKCGDCCEWVKCPQLDKATRLCKIYNKRPKVCRKHPCQEIEISEVDCKGFKSKG